MDKHDLRQQIRTQRKEIQDRGPKNQAIADRLEAHPLFQKANTILFYVSNDEEVDTHSLIKKVLDQKTVIVPTIDPKTDSIHLFHLEQWGDLSDGHYGILEVSQPDRKPFEGDLDLIIVPGIAFDQNGHRLGYGKGYYDSLLKHHDAPTIGLGYDIQLTSDLPNEPHDVSLDFVLTETQTLSTS
jgi:5-formyltetrahydrofolate cyclo-ligase